MSNHNLSIPRDKNYPPDAVQCDRCGGLGTRHEPSVIGDDCAVCEGKGWLPAGHSGARLCAREACSTPILPRQIAVYCTSQCAMEDA